MQRMQPRTTEAYAWKEGWTLFDSSNIEALPGKADPALDPRQATPHNAINVVRNMRIIQFNYFSFPVFTRILPCLFLSSYLTNKKAIVIESAG